MKVYCLMYHNDLMGVYATREDAQKDIESDVSGPYFEIIEYPVIGA